MVKKYVREYVIMTFSLLVFVFGWVAFLIPKEITGGGIAGLAAVIQYATGFDVAYSNFIINMSLLVVGFIVLGKGFGIKTIYCIAVSSLFFKYLPEVMTWTSPIEEPFLNALIGGAFSGLGVGMCFTQGGSTGGTDIIALIVNKYKNIPPGRIYLLCDTLIISSILLVPGKSLQDLVYGYLEAIACSYALDMVLTGTKQSVQLLIMSDKFEEIADRLSQMRQGVTSFSSVGWYTKKEKNMLMVVCNKNNSNAITKVAKDIDPAVFMLVIPVSAFYGGVELDKKLKK